MKCSAPDIVRVLSISNFHKMFVLLIFSKFFAVVKAPDLEHLFFAFKTTNALIELKFRICIFLFIDIFIFIVSKYFSIIFIMQANIFIYRYSRKSLSPELHV